MAISSSDGFRTDLPVVQEFRVLWHEMATGAAIKDCAIGLGSNMGFMLKVRGANES
jgi:hypothetical protein